MCEVCNESLLAGASAAKDLAQAAFTLESVNFSEEAKVLAKAAADLFRPEASKPNAGSGETNGAQSSENAKESDLERARRALNESLPESVKIGEDGVLYLNGKAVGQAVLVRR